MTKKLSMDIPATYRIQVHGRLEKNWFAYHDNMTIAVETGMMDRPMTTLTGRVPDQAALQGILTLLYDLQMPLISVEWLSSDE